MSQQRSTNSNSSEIKAAAHRICSMLITLGINHLVPECFRLAKLNAERPRTALEGISDRNHNPVSIKFWCAMHDLCLIESRSLWTVKDLPNRMKKLWDKTHGVKWGGNIVQYVKSQLFEWGYPLQRELLSIGPDDKVSRKLLLSFSWLLVRVDFFEWNMRRNFGMMDSRVILPMPFSPTIGSGEDVPEQRHHIGKSTNKSLKNDINRVLCTLQRLQHAITGVYQSSDFSSKLLHTLSTMKSLPVPDITKDQEQLMASGNKTMKFPWPPTPMEFVVCSSSQVDGVPSFSEYESALSFCITTLQDVHQFYTWIDQVLADERTAHSQTIKVGSGRKPMTVSTPETKSDIRDTKDLVEPFQRMRQMLLETSDLFRQSELLVNTDNISQSSVVVRSIEDHLRERLAKTRGEDGTYEEHPKLHFEHLLPSFHEDRFYREIMRSDRRSASREEKASRDPERSAKREIKRLQLVRQQIMQPLEEHRDEQQRQVEHMFPSDQYCVSGRH